MWTVLLAALTTPAGIDVEATTIDGARFSGSIVSLSSETLALHSFDGDKMLAVRDLLAVTPAEPPTSDFQPHVWIELVDGSRWHAVRYTAAKGKATVELNAARQVEVETRSVRWVRFRPHDQSPPAEPWDKILGGELAGDTLVIRKTVPAPGKDEGDEPPKTEVSLDVLEGILHDVTDESVEFEFAGDRVPVKRPRVEGLIYFHAATRELPQPVARIIDADGSEWVVKSIELREERLELTTVAGVAALLDATQVAKFDFALGNTVFLSDLTPERVEVKPPLDFGAVSAAKQKMYEPQTDRVFGGGKLTLFNEPYEKGLSLRSQTTLVYRLPDGAKRFRAKAGIDQLGGASGRVQLTITSDRATLFDGPIAGDDPAAVELDLDVAGYRRLTITVHYGEQPDVGDFLDLCSARIVK